MIKNLPTNKSPGPDGFTVNSTQHLEKSKHLFISNFLKKIEEEGTFPTSFYKTTITLIKEKHINRITKEIYRSISLMNTDTKILNKILANRIQQHIKSNIRHDQVGFIPGM